MVAAEKQETKPPVDQHLAGHDAKTDSTAHLQQHVQDIHAGGNLKHDDAKVAGDRDKATQIYGHVDIGDHQGKPATATSTAPGEHAPPPGGDAHKPEAKPAESGVLNWFKNTASSAEQLGADAIHGTTAAISRQADRAETAIGHGIDNTKHFLGTAEKAVSTEYASAKKTVGEDYDAAKHAIGHKIDQAKVVGHNLGDVAETLGAGLKDSAVHTAEGAWKGIKTGVNATVDGVEHTGEWIAKNPGKTAAIVGGVAVLAVAEVATGGLATGAIIAGAGAIAEVGGAVLSAPAVVAGFEYAGVAAAGVSTVNAGIDVAKHGELGTIMNQQNERPEDVQAARNQLKNDTGAALLSDATVGAGFGIKYAAKGISALRAASAESSAAKTAIEGESHTPSKLAEEVADGATVIGVMDRFRQIMSGANSVYENVSGASSTLGTVKGVVGTAGRIGSTYSTATPQKPGTDNNDGGKSSTPDEPTKH